MLKTVTRHFSIKGVNWDKISLKLTVEDDGKTRGDKRKDNEGHQGPQGSEEEEEEETQ